MKSLDRLTFVQRKDALCLANYRECNANKQHSTRLLGCC